MPATMFTKYDRCVNIFNCTWKHVFKTRMQTMGTQASAMAQYPTALTLLSATAPLIDTKKIIKM